MQENVEHLPCYYTLTSILFKHIKKPVHLKAIILISTLILIEKFQFWIYYLGL
jgi:plastocyanin domain-containing protein